jgi:long-chain acyl-CoA synthetase
LFEQQSKTGIAFGLDGKGPHLVTGPLYHAAPLLFALYDLVNGAQLFIMAKWDAEQVLALIQRYRIRHSHFVPTMFIRVLRLDEDTKQAYDLSSLTVVLHGAAPITPEVKCQMLDWWGDVLFEYWGGSEGGTATLIDPFVWRQHPGSVGQAIPGLEVFALDKAKQQLPAGEVGLLYCQRSDGRAVFEYFNDPIKTAAAHQGAAYTLGDIGYIDEQGFVFLKDRQSRMIISGGVNIYPQELERHLDMLPDLDDSVVFGVPDAEWGEQVAAVIQASGQWLGSDDELIAKVMDHLAPKVASYKLPRHVLVRASLPRQLNGKLYLDPLKQSVIASLAAIERQG